MKELFSNELDDLDIIRGYLESDIPIYLHGLSGDGKSRRAKDIDPNLTIIYLSNATPESINGKSVLVPPITKKVINENNEIEEVIIKESYMDDIKPSWLIKLENKCENEKDRLHILLFDELSNALPTIQNFIFNIILNKEVNGKWKLPKNVRIIAAGNEMEESIVANEITKPLFSRFAHIYLKVDINNWIKWATNAKIHPLIITFHYMTNGKYLRSEYTGNNPNADPRRWEMVSNILYQEESFSSLDTVIPKNMVTNLIAFAYNNIIPLSSVIENELYDDVKKYLSKMTREEKYLTVANYSQVDNNHFDEIYEIIECMNDEKLLKLFFLLTINNRYKDTKIKVLK